MTEPLSGSTPDAGPKASATPPRRNATARTREVLRSDHNDGWLMAVELVTATFTWGGIGFLVDRYWLGTEPIFMSIGFVVGFFAGMYLLWLKTNGPLIADGEGGGDDGGA